MYEKSVAFLIPLGGLGHYPIGVMHHQSIAFERVVRAGSILGDTQTKGFK